MKRIHVLLFLSALLSGCGSDGVAGVDPPVAGVAIDFSSSVSQVQTRGAALTSITEMYIYASYTGTANWKSASHCFDYMHDQYAHNPGSGWTYTPLKYWPGESTDKISFFAYAPVAAKDKLTVSAIGSKNPTFAYTVPATESAQLDFLVASQLNCTNATGKVMFSMQHALAQVVVKVKNGDATVSDVTLSALRLTMPRRGTLTFGDTGYASGKQFTWAPASEKQDIDADVTVGGSPAKTLSLGASTAAAKSAATFFLLPVSDPSASVQFHLTYTLTKNAGENNSGTSPVLTTTIAPSATPAWAPGKIYTYTISILDDRMEIDGVTVKDFDANGTPAGGDVAAT